MKNLLFAFLFLFTIPAKAQNDPGLTTGDTGTVSFIYQGSPVTYTTVRAADGLIWTQQNLGSPTIALYASDTLAYGHYFQWGRWDDGHQLPNSIAYPAAILNPAKPSAIQQGSDTFYFGSYADHWWEDGVASDTWSAGPPSVTNGHDPCSALGPGWRLPTQPEFAQIISLEGIVDTASAYNSNLKLTLAGRRGFEYGDIGFRDTSANYWTASPSDTLASLIYISEDYLNPNWPVYRGYGASIRCVATCTGVYPPDDIFGPDTVCQTSIQTFTAQGFTYASDYLWTLPVGWNFISSQNGATITVLAGNTGGQIIVRSANYCDTSLATIKSIFVAPLPQPVISQNGTILSTGNYTSYQWLYNGVPIQGANNSSYNITSTGNYSVIVTDINSCSDTSAIYLATLSVSPLSTTSEIKVYPNPAYKTLNITAPFALNIAIYSIDGRLVLQKENATAVDISALQEGIYHLHILDSEGKVLKTQPLNILAQ